MGGLFPGTLLHRAGFDVALHGRSEHGLAGRGAGLVAQREVGCEHMAHVGVTAHARVYLDRAGAFIQVRPSPQMQLSWDTLFQTLRNQVPDARYRGGSAVAGAVHEGRRPLLHLADGPQVAGDLGIGADGIGSAVWPVLPGADGSTAPGRRRYN